MDSGVVHDCLRLRGWAHLVCTSTYQPCRLIITVAMPTQQLWNSRLYGIPPDLIFRLMMGRAAYEISYNEALDLVKEVDGSLVINEVALAYWG